MQGAIEKVAVIGLGYIGLPTAALLASRGLHVAGVDINQQVVETINSGKIHIIEPDLDVLVHNVVNNGYLRASLVPQPADVFLITVPTPFKNNHEPDLVFVEAAAQSIASVLKKGDIIILESTSPLGTTEQMCEQLVALRPDLIFPGAEMDHADIAIAYCPERVMPGQILRELIENDRIIGGITAQCAERAKALYKLFVRGECVTTDARTAEMAKLTENAYRDVNIAFANELSIICDAVNVNVWELIKLANRHPRVTILQPGPGVGGHCIAVDPWFIVHAAPEQAKLIRAAREINDHKPYYVLEKIKDAAKGIARPVIACLGLAYKADTNDLRESPALTILQELILHTDYPICVVEPNIDELPAKFLDYSQLKLMALDEALAAANIIVCLAAHKEFKQIDASKLQDKLIIPITNLEANEVVSVSALFRNQARPVSEYGRMMMNKIYGHIP